MSDEEMKAIMDAILGGFREQKAAIEGLTHEVAQIASMDVAHAARRGTRINSLAGRFSALEDRVGAVEERLTAVEERLTAVEERLTAVEERLTAVEKRLTAVEENLEDLREELHEGLTHLGERWLEHDKAIYSLRRKRAET